MIGTGTPLFVEGPLVTPEQFPGFPSSAAALIFSGPLCCEVRTGSSVAAPLVAGTLFDSERVFIPDAARSFVASVFLEPQICEHLFEDSVLTTAGFLVRC